jgi:Zn2+/Cd2+-exporting ATPase
LKSAKSGSSEHSESHSHGDGLELTFAIISAALLAVGFGASFLPTIPHWLVLACYVGSYFFGGAFAVKEAFSNLFQKKFEIDTLMIVAATGAAILGEWAEGALLLALFSLGHALEHFAMGRAKKAIEALAELAPETANVLRDGKFIEVGVQELAIGEIVLIKPNERFPVDGIVLKGSSDVNQAPVTGESVPVAKGPVSAPALAENFQKLPDTNRVFAASINGPGALEVSVARKAGDSTLARVIKMVSDEKAKESPTQELTKKFEHYFVPSVLALVVLLLFAFMVIDEPFAASFYRAMAVLVAASPCALAISTPSAVLSGIARAGQRGVLIKGGAALEALGSVDSIAFDKTGTLTNGKPKLTDIAVADGAVQEELLSIVEAVESQSDHPLAQALVEGARELKITKTAVAVATSVKSIIGRGVSAVVGGITVVIGKPVLFDEIEGQRIPDNLKAKLKAMEAKGLTTMVVRKGNDYLGILGVIDSPRASSVSALAAIRQLGIENLIMLSGDNQTVANTIAKEVGITKALGDLMPEDKVRVIGEHRQSGLKIAMVGDGVNDAPAMASANVAIAMGAAGSDVALETADVALMNDDLSQLPFAVGLSRMSNAVIKQNLWVSLGVVAVLIPATILGLGIGPAVVAHEGSTILVVMNALRILAFSKKSENKPRGNK